MTTANEKFLLNNYPSKFNSLYDWLIYRFDYDLEQGKLYHKNPPYNLIKLKNQEAGFVHKNKGYRLITIKGKQFRVHRVICFMHYGEWPKEHLDHEDADKLNNVYENLRPATQAENNHNRRSFKNTTSIYKGVHAHKRSGKWKANFHCNNKTYDIGLYKSEKEAAYERDKFALKSWKEGLFESRYCPFFKLS